MEAVNDMKRELLELGSIGGQRSSWGHNEGKDFQIFMIFKFLWISNKWQFGQKSKFIIRIWLLSLNRKIFSLTNKIVSKVQILKRNQQSEQFNSKTGFFAKRKTDSYQRKQHKTHSKQKVDKIWNSKTKDCANSTS